MALSQIVLGCVSVALGWQLGLAVYALGYAYLGFSLHSFYFWVGSSALVASFVMLRHLRGTESPRLILRSVGIAILLFPLFLDWKNGGWVSTQGADGGNHWAIYGDLLLGDRTAYQGFTAFHWGVHFWKGIFPGVSGLAAVMLAQTTAILLTLFFAALNWGNRSLDCLILIACAVSLRVLVGEGYFSQSFAWSIYFFLLWSISRTALQFWTLLGWGACLASLRGIYGGDIPLLLTALGFWAFYRTSDHRMRILASIYALAGGIGMGLLAPMMLAGGGFLYFGTHEAFGILIASGVLFLFFRRKRSQEADFLRQYVLVSSGFFAAAFLFAGKMDYYFVKLLLFAAICIFAAWRSLWTQIPPRFESIAQGAYVLAWAAVFQRYVVLTLLWGLTSLKPTAALPHQFQEDWMRTTLTSRGCLSYLYLTEDWARYNWTNHILSRNPRVSLEQRDFLANLKRPQTDVPKNCVFIERNSDRKSGRPRITSNWTCVHSGIASIGEICAGPEN